MKKIGINEDEKIVMRNYNDKILRKILHCKHELKAGNIIGEQ